MKPMIGDTMSAEDYEAAVNLLVKQMEQGNTICISDCRSLQDTEDDIKIWKLICLNHIQKNTPEFKDDYEYTNYWDMVRIMISSSVMENGSWVTLSGDFIADVIMFSNNQTALTIISDMKDEDVMHDYGTSINLELFNRLRRLAKERLSQLDQSTTYASNAHKDNIPTYKSNKTFTIKKVLQVILGLGLLVVGIITMYDSTGGLSTGVMCGAILIVLLLVKIFSEKK